MVNSAKLNSRIIFNHVYLPVYFYHKTMHYTAKHAYGTLKFKQGSASLSWQHCKPTYVIIHYNLTPLDIPYINCNLISNETCASIYIYNSQTSVKHINIQRSNVRKSVCRKKAIKSVQQKVCKTKKKKSCAMVL